MDKAQAGRNRRIWRIVLGIALFSALMALHGELSSEWAKAAVAGCAVVVLSLAILMPWRARS